MSSYPPPPPDPNEQNPYGQSNPYGQPNPYGQQPGGAVDHPRGTTILILGIVSLVCCGLLTGIPAIIMGKSALAEIDAAPYQYSNRGAVKAGYICGIIGTVLSALGILLNVILLAVGASLY
jgi:hypothetical protein